MFFFQWASWYRRSISYAAFLASCRLPSYPACSSFPNCYYHAWPRGRNSVTVWYWWIEAGRHHDDAPHQEEHWSYYYYYYYSKATRSKSAYHNSTSSGTLCAFTTSNTSSNVEPCCTLTFRTNVYCTSTSYSSDDVVDVLVGVMSFFFDVAGKVDDF